MPCHISPSATSPTRGETVEFLCRAYADVMVLAQRPGLGRWPRSPGRVERRNGSPGPSGQLVRLGVRPWGPVHVSGECYLSLHSLMPRPTGGCLQTAAKEYIVTQQGGRGQAGHQQAS